MKDRPATTETIGTVTAPSIAVSEGKQTEPATALQAKRAAMAKLDPTADDSGNANKHDGLHLK
jgi:hypothetical protein